MREALNLDYSLLIPEYLLGLLAILIIAVDMLLPNVKKQMLPYPATLKDERTVAMSRKPSPSMSTNSRS